MTSGPPLVALPWWPWVLMAVRVLVECTHLLPKAKKKVTFSIRDVWSVRSSSFYFRWKIWLEFLKKKIFPNWAQQIASNMWWVVISKKDSNSLPARWAWLGLAQFRSTDSYWDGVVHKAHALNWKVGEEGGEDPANSWHQLLQKQAGLTLTQECEILGEWLNKPTGRGGQEQYLPSPVSVHPWVKQK